MYIIVDFSGTYPQVRQYIKLDKKYKIVNYATYFNVWWPYG
jgi:hypothetical protein